MQRILILISIIIIYLFICVYVSSITIFLINTANNSWFFRSNYVMANMICAYICVAIYFYYNLLKDKKECKIIEIEIQTQLQKFEISQQKYQIVKMKKEHNNIYEKLLL